MFAGWYNVSSFAVLNMLRNSQSGWAEFLKNDPVQKCTACPLSGHKQTLFEFQSEPSSSLTPHHVTHTNEQRPRSGQRLRERRAVFIITQYRTQRGRAKIITFAIERGSVRSRAGRCSDSLHISTRCQLKCETRTDLFCPRDNAVARMP